MILALRASATYELPGETFLCLMVEPSLTSVGHRLIEERLVTSPTASCVLKTDLFGNPQRHIVAPAGTFSFEFRARVDAEPNGFVPDEAFEIPPQRLPIETMPFTLASRYCQSDLLARMAQGEFGSLPPGGARVRGIAEWVRTRVEYRYGTTDALTSAFDTATERIGVCRDFAHLVIAFCRALGLPARYVAGYALGLEPPDFHGYAQVYLGGAWHNVDATTADLRPALVAIAVGRDAADVAMMTFWGRNTLKSQSVEVRAVS